MISGSCSSLDRCWLRGSGSRRAAETRGAAGQQRDTQNHWRFYKVKYCASAQSRRHEQIRNSTFEFRLVFLFQFDENSSLKKKKKKKNPRCFQIFDNLSIVLSATNRTQKKYYVA